MHTVLIIEDEPDLAALLTDILESAGYKAVLTTANQAVVRTAELAPSAIIMDYRMPGLNGGEVIRRLREAHESRTPPIILVSGLPDIAELAREVRADAFLRKPFDLDAFVSTVDQLVRARAE